MLHCLGTFVLTCTVEKCLVFYPFLDSLFFLRALNSFMTVKYSDVTIKNAKDTLFFVVDESNRHFNVL